MTNTGRRGPRYVDDPELTAQQERTLAEAGQKVADAFAKPSPHVVRLPTPHWAEEWRCERCNKLLVEYRPLAGLWLRERCPRCGHWQEKQLAGVAA